MPAVPDVRTPGEPAPAEPTTVVPAGLDAAEPTRFGAVVRFLWRSSRRAIVIVAGGALVVGGVAMLVLPGPGLLVIIAGLAVLAKEFVWAERALHSMKRKAAQGANTAKRLARRRTPPPPDV